MSMAPDSSAAPPMLTEAPPDTQPMTIGEHFMAIISMLQSPEPLDPDTMREVKAGFMGIEGALKMKVQGQQQQAQQPGQPQPGGPPSNATEDYGAGAGSPVNL